MRIWTLSGMAILALFYTGSASAWGRGGHRAICVTAWSDFSEDTRAQVRSLLDLQGADQFAEACFWADDVRLKRPKTGPWHYVNIPKDARSIELERDCRAPASCLIEQIERQAVRLSSGAPKWERAEALKYLAHFVGDLHQPLHVGFAEDRGGNEISLRFLGRKTNMHALWDWGLLETPAPPADVTYPHLKAALHKLQRSRWSKGSVHDWAQETLWVMRAPATGYVGNPGGLDFGDVYVSQNQPVARAQIEKAGLRLAALLNSLFK
jgi:hypothetical protein